MKRVAKSLAYPNHRRREVAGILKRQNAAIGAGTATLENLTRLEKGAVAVTTGQQVGLFSGPAYAVYKAIAAMQMAKELTSAGIPAVPVFWMATEDHDLDEVRHTTWFHEGKLTRFELPASSHPGIPVGKIPLEAEAETLVNEAADILSKSGSELLAGMLRESYGHGETLGSSFGKLFTRLFAEEGLILLDPLDADLHRVAAHVLQKALEDRDALNEELLKRDEELERSGFGAQVKVTARSSLVFFMGKGIRQPIGWDGGRFSSGSQLWRREELLQAVHREPQNFSPNALLRPVVQDFLLPTAAFIAGPAEISYLAQSEVIYRRVLGRMPVVLPRAGFTLVDAKAEKLLQKYRLKVEDIWSGSQEVRKKMEAASVPKSLAKNFERNMKLSQRMFEQLSKQVVGVDATLTGAVETAREKISFALEKLRRQLGEALDQKAGLISGHEQFLEALLYPHKSLQSRELCFLPFLARLGMRGLSDLQKHASSKNLGKHILVRIP